MKLSLFSIFCMVYFVILERNPINQFWPTLALAPFLKRKQPFNGFSQHFTSINKFQASLKKKMPFLREILKCKKLWLMMFPFITQLFKRLIRLKTHVCLFHNFFQLVLLTTILNYLFSVLMYLVEEWVLFVWICTCLYTIFLDCIK